MIPITDHSILSPNGRVSKRAREAAIERTRRTLFGDGLAFPSGPQRTEKEIDLRRAEELRGLAKRGMKPRAYLKEAQRLEAKHS